MTFPRRSIAHGHTAVERRAGNQPSLSGEAWQEVFNKMITAYKAPVSPDDAKAIVDYLVRTKCASLLR
jgi:hypothetical protein